MIARRAAAGTLAPAVAAAEGPAGAPRPGALPLAGARRWLAGAFTLCSAARLVAYLPTLWAIHASADSSQHSLWTWGIWLLSNLTMAAWLCERAGGRPDRAALASAGNALMCLAAVALIAWHRW
ncbi:MAG: hypothetical protein KIS83_03495 [Rubrivivax sp.]|nr:hypothetical protein [Rubrivivax sp.]